MPNHPFTVTGRRGAILGMQDGSIELWQLPVKFFSALHLTAEVSGYPVPIDLNSAAESIVVSPDHTTILYSHAAITVRQHMFVPAGEGNDGLGGVVLFEIAAIHPATLTVSLQPDMVREWPAPQYGHPGWDWNSMGQGGAYVVATDNPGMFGMIGMANATPGINSPYQERPHTLPLQFRVHFDPANDSGKYFPLLCELNRSGEVLNAAGIETLKARLVARSQAIPAIYERTRNYYAHFFETRLVAHTPDPRFDLALQWAELAIDKAQVTTLEGETGLVAGWYPSFDSARPGFGWFFGRDTLWSMYAIDSYGDAALARRAFEFLIKRQRADGKMMHEFSQTAGSLSGEMAWSNFPYEYAAADSTPLYLLAMQDYVRATGDTAFLKQHWDSVLRAYRFERTHDSDGDGVYDNSEGTGWVEGWPPKSPHQELYLAALDRDATAAMAELARWEGDASLAAETNTTAAMLGTRVEEYKRSDGTYAFSKNADGTFDPTLTVYPSVAMWSSGRGMAQPETMLRDWAGNHFETDWGTRALADTDPVYDPISYHQGTVWPLFTGWSSMAEYRGGHPLAGYAALFRNVDLTWAQDPGSVTEVLSGRFYQPLGRSSTHQLWSSAMILSPALRGLFGLEADATTHTLAVHPHLPASWNLATLDHLMLGGRSYSVRFERIGAELQVTATSEAPTVLCLLDILDLDDVKPCAEPAKRVHRFQKPLPGVEVEVAKEGLPEPGAETHQAHVTGEVYEPHALALTLEGQPGETVRLKLRRNTRNPLQAEGAEIEGDTMQVTLPPGSGWVSRQVKMTW
ncbi:MAG TPA: glycogen debranching protein [Acidobacteriaceae bacterium]|jgi:glycogen debranching enzyme